jgi:transcriptional regulator with XRE-family HTH domain
MDDASSAPFGEIEDTTISFDERVGKRLRKRRWILGLTLKQLAKKVGVRFQQIQQYELGANRMSLSKAVDVADALEITIGQLVGEESLPHSNIDVPAEGACSMLRTFNKLSPKLKKKALEFVEGLAIGEEDSCSEV